MPLFRSIDKETKMEWVDYREPSKYHKALMLTTMPPAEYKGVLFKTNYEIVVNVVPNVFENYEKPYEMKIPIRIYWRPLMI